MGVSSVTGLGRCGAVLYATDVNLVVIPQAPGQCLGAQESSLPAPVSSVQAEGFCREPNLPTSHLQLDF